MLFKKIEWVRAVRSVMELIGHTAVRTVSREKLSKLIPAVSHDGDQ